MQYSADSNMISVYVCLQAVDLNGSRQNVFFQDVFRLIDSSTDYSATYIIHILPFWATVHKTTQHTRGSYLACTVSGTGLYYAVTFKYLVLTDYVAGTYLVQTKY